MDWAVAEVFWRTGTLMNPAKLLVPTKSWMVPEKPLADTFPLAAMVAIG